MAFCKITAAKEGNQQSAVSKKLLEGKQNQVPPFFFCTDRGLLVFADDLGHCTEVQQLSSAIDILLFYEEKAKLIVITRSLLLTQYQVSEDGRVSRTMQVKLSVAGDAAEAGLRSVVWAGSGVLAIATHEKLVRILDLANDESYNLSLSQVPADKLPRNDVVVHVAFNPLDRQLVVGTMAGAIVIWKYVGAFREGNRVVEASNKDWEVSVVVLYPCLL